MGVPSDHTARGSIWYTTVWGERPMTSALSTTLVSSCGVRSGPTRNTCAQMALPSMRPAGVSPAAVWSLSVVGTWSRATVAVPPLLGTNSGAGRGWAALDATAPVLGLETELHADATTHTTKAAVTPLARRRPIAPDSRRPPVTGAGARRSPPARPAVTAGAGPRSQW